MKDHSTARHPGPWRVMQVDSEVAGIIVAVGFLAMGLVSMPIARWFVLGCFALGIVVAVLLRFTPKRLGVVVLGTRVVLVALPFWWAGMPRQRPHNVSYNALHVRPENAGVTLRDTGYWLDCWFDKDEKLDRCRLANAKGTAVFEDVFLPCAGQTPIPQTELQLDKRRTGSSWTRSPDNRISVPAVYLEHGQVLLPRRFFAEARQNVYCD